MWANSERDGRVAKYRWHPLFNAAKFHWCTLLECRAVTMPSSNDAKTVKPLKFVGMPQTNEPISATADWMCTILPYFHTWCGDCGLSANLGCGSETCCMRLADNTGCKKIVKNSPSGHNRTTLSGYIFTTKACIDNRKKVVTQQYHPTSRQYGELRPTSSWDRFVSLGHPS